jgi:hypothetical protein
LSSSDFAEPHAAKVDTATRTRTARPAMSGAYCGR